MPEPASSDESNPSHPGRLFQESCVLLPFHSLEDFPQGGADEDARSLLSAWSVLWHPLVITRCGSPPQWAGVDSLAEISGDRLIAVYPNTRNDPSLQGRHDFTDFSYEDGEHPVFARSGDPTQQTTGSGGASSDPIPGNNWVVSGPDRASILHQLGLGAEVDPRGQQFWGRCPESLSDSSRQVTPEDFFALAYASLQIQVMTRRLRYSSNLDTILLNKHATAAARCFVEGSASATVDALHAAFDLLSEERDHYFASDPSLIDLTLLTPGTLSRLNPAQFDQRPLPESSAPVAEHAHQYEDSDSTSVDEHVSSAEGDSSENTSGRAKESDGVLPLPGNVLMDEACCQAMETSGPSHGLDWFRSAIAEGRIGLATGGPSEIRFDEHDYRHGAHAIQQAHGHAVAAFGRRPTVYARLSGSTPVDLTSVLARLGFKGVIPLDFVRGTGHGAEAKVLLQTGAGELEALTSKPMDANADAAFLNLAAKLGESIDSGEIATGLFAHWPGEGCTSFRDLRRAASWSLALGKFWRLEDYFVDGEHPYHHADTSALGNDAIESLQQRVESETSPVFASIAEKTQQEQKRQAIRGQSALLTVATGELSSEDSGQGIHSQVRRFASALKLPLSEDDQGNPTTRLILNHHSSGQRTHVSLSERPSSKTKQVYAVSQSRETRDGKAGFVVTSDTPGLGFSIVTGDSRGETKPSLFSKEKWFPKGMVGAAEIARGETLQNQFLEASIQKSSGGIGAVFSGQQRGNRFSLRLICVREDQGEKKCEMICDGVRSIESAADVGILETNGRLVMSDSGSSESQSVIGEFRLRYELQRGSRMILVDGELNSLQPCEGAIWKNYYGVRVATALDSALDRVIVRDKLHRSIGRRMVAPLGVLIDESERETLVASGGFAYHRRIGQRFLDTLVATRQDRSVRFRFGYAFDPKSPIATAKSLLVPATDVALRAAGSDGAENAGGCSQQWLVHRSPSTVDVNDMQFFRRQDGNLAARVQLIQTTNQTVRASLRFCRPMEFACTLDDETTDLTVASLDQFSTSLEVQSDQLRLSMSGHAVVDLLVVFRSESGTD